MSCTCLLNVLYLYKQLIIRTMKTMNTTSENKVWAILSIYAVSIITIAILLTSCGASRGCHTKGYYVDKSVKKAQSKARY